MSEPQITAKLKVEVAQRANGCCEYCRSQAQFSPDPFSIEHIMPIPKYLGVIKNPDPKPVPPMQRAIQVLEFYI
jgi:hypothetical protein